MPANFIEHHTLTQPQYHLRRGIQTIKAFKCLFPTLFHKQTKITVNSPVGQVDVRMGNHPGVPVLYAWGSQVSIVFYISTSHLRDHMWAEFSVDLNLT